MKIQLSVTLESGEYLALLEFIAKSFRENGVELKKQDVIRRAVREYLEKQGMSLDERTKRQVGTRSIVGEQGRKLQ